MCFGITQSERQSREKKRNSPRSSSTGKVSFLGGRERIETQKKTRQRSRRPSVSGKGRELKRWSSLSSERFEHSRKRRRGRLLKKSSSSRPRGGRLDKGGSRPPPRFPKGGEELRRDRRKRTTRKRRLGSTCGLRGGKRGHGMILSHRERRKERDLRVGRRRIEIDPRKRKRITIDSRKKRGRKRERVPLSGRKSEKP